MKNWIYIVIVFILSLSCKEKTNSIPVGIWRAELKVTEGNSLPFNFRFLKKREHYTAEIYNGAEIITVNHVNIFNDSIIIHMPVFQSYIKGVFTNKTINGVFINETFSRKLTFNAQYGEENRFISNVKANELVSGIWETNFDPNSPNTYKAKGMFIQNGNKVTGTFRTETGDYRFLEGVVTGDSLKLSTFDGVHAFLFLAKINDTIMDGVFYSGNKGKESFVAKRNEAFELPNENLVTFLKEGHEIFDFSFPDKTGKLISLSDKQFKDKPVVVQIMGTWCANSLDETRFLVDFLNQHKEIKIPVVSLAFEFAKTEEKAFQGIEKLKNDVGISYPILLAQYGGHNKQKAQEKLPMLNHILSYPTLVIIDKKRKVRKIVTGFNGPATGDKYSIFKKEFIDLVNVLIKE